MLETVTTYIERHHLLPASGEIIVAVSGGADSLCLLHLLHRLCGPGRRYPGLRLHVAHLNHKLRGEAGAQDAATVAHIATAWGLPVTVGELDVPALARQDRRSLEDAARVARYRFLREVACGQPIAIAHHADDQVETLLLHWLRGGGLAGMVGMLPRQQDIIRPLLEVSHAQTVAYCRQHQIVPLEDASNTDSRFLRNRIRHELLPLLESLKPGMRATLTRTAEVMRVDAEWIEAQVGACWPTVVSAEQDDSIRLNLASLLALPLSIQRHLVRRVTAKLCVGQSPLELRHYTLIEQLLHKESAREDSLATARVATTPEDVPGAVNERSGDHVLDKSALYRSPGLDLPHQLHVTRKAGEVVFERSSHRPMRAFSHDKSGSYNEEQKEVLLPIPGRVEVPGTPWMAIAETLSPELLQEVKQALRREEWSRVWQLLPSTPYTVYVDAESLATARVLTPTRDVPGAVNERSGDHVLDKSALYRSPGPLQVRTRRPGDRVRPLGMAHEKKVQDVLVDKHIARADRAHIPLFFSTSHCVWLAGVCLDDRVRLTSRTQRIIRLSIIACQC